MSDVSANVLVDFDDTLIEAISEIFGVRTTNRRKVYDAFFRNFNPFVVSELTKRNTFTLNFEDLASRIWVDFSGSSSGVGLIERFFAQVSNGVPDLPATIDGHGVAKMLNVTFKMWEEMWRARNVAKLLAKRVIPVLPQPIEGVYSDPAAKYSTMEVFTWFVEFEPIRSRFISSATEWVFQFPLPKPTKRYFVNYLKTSIVNRWANFCRYESRRHQERVWDTFYDQRSTMEDPPPWEDRQETPSNQEEDAELALLVGRLQRSVASSEIKPILMAMFDDGVSVREAIERSTLSVEQKRRAVREVCTSVAA